ncbi:hypothetical protein H4R18_004052 [Coemansia javaensis]|uniref:Uncharacterized protein n=1 Tax=Coemansia javaensis TaxID=2761396 RepID=A0A9W8HBW7_9FUNG|nr:hypothetical protein H4R18_004052 [Coemansia javaensis]
MADVRRRAAGNNRADELAGEAHADEVQEWSLRLGSPPGRLLWLAWDEHCVPAAPNAVVHPDFLAGNQELYGQMTALNWFHSGDGCYAGKKCHQRMPDYDSTKRSLGLKLLLGAPPAMQWQTTWHPNAYPEPEMRGRPKGHPKAAPVETMGHFLECPIGDVAPKQTSQMGKGR